jgi:hypothetical protein
MKNKLLLMSPQRLSLVMLSTAPIPTSALRTGATPAALASASWLPNATFAGFALAMSLPRRQTDT